MSVETPRHTASSPPSTGYYDTQGEGWLSFAGAMLMLVGVLNIVGGIAAIGDSKFYVGSAQYILSDLNTWGWVILITGVVQALAAIGIWTGNQFARWLGVGFAGLNALAQMLMLPAFPLWSLALFTVDVLIIYGLIAYGGRRPSAV